MTSNGNGNGAGGYRIAVDTGGTFTDAVISQAAEIVSVGKSPTTPKRLADGFRGAVEHAGAQLGLELGDLLARTDRLVFGTTHAVNALVQRRTAKTALLTSDGFADMLLFREGGRPDDLLFEYNVEFPDPYIPRSRTFEIAGRIDSEGEIVRPLDEDAVLDVLRRLREREFEAVAVSLLWSVLNPAHEQRIGELIEQELPGVPYTLSHRLLRIIREYRRASATAIDASLKPLVQQSLGDLASQLRSWGYGGPILVGTSAGGCVPIDQAVERPVTLLKSGPAMAPVAGRSFARDEALASDVIVCDTGGTTFDVGLIRNDEIVFTRDTWFGPVGTGELVAISSVDIRSIGAGGGSIAHVDKGGMLHVGPQSAGSDPGPACYARGGTEPTVTDAAAVLGYLQPDYFLGGRMTLDIERARQAVAAVASQIGMDVETAAAGILTLANEVMIDAITELTLNVGLDPRENVLVAGGGAAGLNIVPIAREMGIEQVLVPRAAGALSACGMQVSDIAFEHSASFVTRTSAFDLAGVNEALAEIDAELDVFAHAAQGQGAAEWTKEFRCEARYAGQVWDVDFRLPSERFTDEASITGAHEAFHDAHTQLFSFADRANDIEFVNWIGRVTGRLPLGPDGHGQNGAAAPAAEPSSTRTAWFDGAPVQTPMYDDATLTPGMTIDGPAIIASPTSTLILDPHSRASVTAADNFLVTVSRPAGA